MKMEPPITPSDPDPESLQELKQKKDQILNQISSLSGPALDQAIDELSDLNFAIRKRTNVQGTKTFTGWLNHFKTYEPE